MTSDPQTDRRLEAAIGHLLRVGVGLAAGVVLVGAAIYLAGNGTRPADYRVFVGEPAELNTVDGIWHEALALHGRGIIQLGLLLLIATPVARVVLAMAGFAVERDWMYVGVAVLVLLPLLYGLFGSS
jgi:uncharacterized membrane protein